MPNQRIRGNQITDARTIVQNVHEEAADAIRTLNVDADGNPISETNPLPVSIENVTIENANLDVQLTHKDATPTPSDVADSVRIGDGVDELAVNDDGSINVNVVSTPSNTENIRSTFDTAPSVASGSETTIVSYIVPEGIVALLQRVTYSGENVATYNLYVNGVLVERMRTHFGGDLSGEMRFIGGAEEGPKYVTGDEITLKVLHTRPIPADFNGRIQVMEIG